MQDARVRIALLVVCLACLGGSGYVFVKGHQSAQPPIVFAAAPSENSSTTPSTAPSVSKTSAVIPRRSTRVYVDVAGAVQRPSLYILPPNSRVMQAVMAAGGPAPGADMDAVNLAQIVTDGEKVFIPKRSAAPKAVSTAPPSVSARIPAPLAASVLPTKIGKRNIQSSKIIAETGELVGLNSATLEQLERLPGVGPSMAARILAYRAQAGGFGRIEDLTLVTGIGPKKYAKIAPFVTLN